MSVVSVQCYKILAKQIAIVLSLPCIPAIYYTSRLAPLVHFTAAKARRSLLN